MYHSLLHRLSYMYSSTTPYIQYIILQYEHITTGSSMAIVSVIIDSDWGRDLLKFYSSSCLTCEHHIFMDYSLVVCIVYAAWIEISAMILSTICSNSTFQSMPHLFWIKPTFPRFLWEIISYRLIIRVSQPPFKNGIIRVFNDTAQYWLQS